MSKEAMKLALEALCDIIPANANIEEVRDKQSKAAAALREALAEQPAQQEPVAWPIETNNQVEALAKQCGWDNRRYMTPADYQIWCDRMREFVQLAAPQAQPAPASASSLGSLKLSMEHSAWEGVIQLSDALKNINEWAAEQPAPAAQQEPVFWYRPVGDDGGYEGPIHNSAIEKVRKMAGTWNPLFTTPQAQPASELLTDEQIADYLGDDYHIMSQEGLRFFKLGEQAAHGITKGNT